ncbi:MAG TPA: CehA/McbA family metallohydrolase [Vicinamibacterales bacterium]|nr:CehA/McbA family metallohydrolase [Vicinamibacterales bacterium]
MPRRLKAAAIVCVVAALVIFVLLPPATRRTEPPPATTVRGAFHIHSERSDGSGSVEDIAAAAARAGLQFIILTDHGDATRTPDAPAYRSGVLVLDGVEINTSAGHYAVIDLPASPYPLAGTASEVIEDVTRLGGFGFVAHPGSPRPALSWRDWDAPIGGLEWINADSEWRDEPRLPLARALITYLFRAPQSMAKLLDRPTAVLEKWDALARTRRIVGLAAADAHARLGVQQRTDPDYSAIHVPLPDYESSFRAFSNHVVLAGPLGGDAAADARRLSSAIREGRVYSVIDALASPGALTFTAHSGSQSATLGGTLPIAGDVLLRASVSAPPGTSLVLLRDGQRVYEVTDGPLEMNGGVEPAVYRVEAYTANAPGGPAVPWIVSNPIYAGLGHAATLVQEPPAPTSRIPARTSEAAGESGPNDTSTVVAAALDDARARTFAGDPAIMWTFSLSPGTPAGQYAAVRVPVTGGLAAIDRIRFMASAAAPMRVWVQLRAPVGNTERWGATFYTGTDARLIDIPFSKFRAIGVTSSALPPLDQVDSILFVVDTLNTLPGTKGSMTISEVGLVK